MISENSPLAKYQILIYTALVVITILIVKLLEPHWIYRHVWVIVIFLLLITMGTIQLTHLASKKLNKQFIQVYFAIMTIRLLISLAFALVFVIKDRENVLVFGLNFIILYLLYLGFEIYTILTNLRTHFKKGIGNE